MTEADKAFKAWYERRTGRELTAEEIREAKRNMLHSLRALSHPQETAQRV